MLKTICQSASWAWGSCGRCAGSGRVRCCSSAVRRIGGLAQSFRRIGSGNILGTGGVHVAVDELDGVIRQADQALDVVGLAVAAPRPAALAKGALKTTTCQRFGSNGLPRAYGHFSTRIRSPLSRSGRVRIVSTHSQLGHLMRSGTALEPDGERVPAVGAYMVDMRAVEGGRHRTGRDDEGLDDERAEDERQDQRDQDRLEGLLDLGGWYSAVWLGVCSL